MTQDGIRRGIKLSNGYVYINNKKLPNFNTAPKYLTLQKGWTRSANAAQSAIPEMWLPLALLAG